MEDQGRRKRSAPTPARGLLFVIFFPLIFTAEYELPPSATKSARYATIVAWLSRGQILLSTATPSI